MILGIGRLTSYLKHHHKWLSPDPGQFSPLHAIDLNCNPMMFNCRVSFPYTLLNAHYVEVHAALPEKDMVRT